jgi:hypothetical protein
METTTKIYSTNILRTLSIEIGLENLENQDKKEKNACLHTNSIPPELGPKI